MSLVKQLAELSGFYAEYMNSFGKKIVMNEKACRLLLTAMGYQLDECSLQKSITKLREEKWHQIIPLTSVIHAEDKEHTITLALPENSKPFDWMLICENGEEFEGDTVPSELTLLEKNCIEGTWYFRYHFPLPELTQGYHQLRINFNGIQYNCRIICAPKTCFNIYQPHNNKVWGFAAQLYSIVSSKNWGIGDYTDLINLLEKSSMQGASLIGLNPLHALFIANPTHISPYSPTSRHFLNPLYIDVTAIPNFSLCKTAQLKVKNSHFQQKITLAKKSHLIDYSLVASLKYEIIKILFDDFYQNESNSYQEINREFNHFKNDLGNDLFLFATFDALDEYFQSNKPNGNGWSSWPIEYQSPTNSKVKEFQQQHVKRIDYFCFLQWLCHRQLSLAAKTAKEKGMPIGLYLDLAVGCDGSGYDVWANKEGFVAKASIGAPPDALNTLGQNWGLTPINPVTLKQQGFQPLIKALRSSMQYAGALRIDHVLGLMRQYWVAPGMDADQGVYVAFPFNDILRVIALESQRNQCIVIGEDLGTVPEGFTELTHNAGLLSYKVLFFERWESGLFKRPAEYPEQSIVTVSTHDLPTLKGWWNGRDLEWKQALNLYPNIEMSMAEIENRAVDRQQLIAALQDMNCLEFDQTPQLDPPQSNQEFSIAAQKYLAQSPCYIQLISLEDALGVVEQVNIPGTIDQHPNWFQKLPVTLDTLWETQSVNQMSSVMRLARPNNHR